MARKPKDGKVKCRVVPFGHGKVHTGENVFPVIDGTQFEDLEGKQREDAEKAARLKAEVACGKVYAKGATLSVDRNIADVLEAKGYVEIMDDSEPEASEQQENSDSEAE